MARVPRRATLRRSPPSPGLSLRAQRSNLPQAYTPREIATAPYGRLAMTSASNCHQDMLYHNILQARRHPMARSRPQIASPFQSAGHDHESCVDGALDRAAQICEERGARLTELRRDVLRLIWRGHEPIGAYGLLEALRRSHPGAAPPTVYRAL